MLPNLKTAAIASITALSIALSTAAPAKALGRDERNILKGIAATLIIGAILKDAKSRAAAPAPTQRPVQSYTPGYRPYDQPRYDQSTSGRVIGATQSIHTTHAARSFNSYGSADRRAIQSRLRAYGYYSGAIDGAFGPATYRAIIAYARDAGGESQLSTIAGAYGVLDGLLA